MIATFMEVMDTSIASVAVPYIAGSTASTNNEAEWVLTGLPGSKRSFSSRQYLVFGALWAQDGS